MIMFAKPKKHAVKSISVKSVQCGGMQECAETNTYTQNQYKQIETKKNNIDTKQTIIYKIHCQFLIFE